MFVLIALCPERCVHDTYLECIYIPVDVRSFCVELLGDADLFFDNTIANGRFDQTTGDALRKTRASSVQN
jgi:hypothetical protein